MHQMADIDQERRSRPSTSTIYIAGDYAQALEAIRSWCTRVGDCWAVERCEYVYTGGQEAGIRATRIEYARYPTASDAHLQRHAEDMGEYLMLKLHQKSCSVVGPVTSVFKTRREAD